MTATDHAVLFQRLVTELEQRSRQKRFAKRTVELLLGTDRFINRNQQAIEKRVGITPDHVQRLHQAFTTCHLGLRTYVVEGAGERAGYSDSDYVHAGAEIIPIEDLEYLDGPPDVVHALKEPSPYEAAIPKPFCRIGALHSGDFGESSGLAQLLLSGPVAVFDGSNIGAPAKYRVPIRGRMSVFAGEIAAEWVLNHLQRHAITRCHAIVVGGGYAGQAAARQLAADERVEGVYIFDDADQPDRLQALRATFAASPQIGVDGIRGIDDPRLLKALDDAAAVIFAVARPKERAPKTVRVESLASMRNLALVVDISIDEGGAIHDPAMRKTWTSKEIIPYLSKRLAAQDHQHEYRAMSNMPRAYPRRASEAHGDVVLPYLTALLYLAAEHGSTSDVLTELTKRSADPSSTNPFDAAPSETLSALTQDLRNGLALSYEDVGEAADESRRIAIHDVIADKDRLCAFLFNSKLPFRVFLPADRDYDIRRIDGPIRDCLAAARDRRVACTFISHPQVDGTRTPDAARALGVNEDEVLKCLVLRSSEIESNKPQFIAAICEGPRRIDLELVGRATKRGPWELATPDEVMLETHHTVGGVPAIELFGKMSVYIDAPVFERSTVWVSAGSEFAGMGLSTHVLRQLGGITAELTPPDGIARQHAGDLRQVLRLLHDALANDDDEVGYKAARKLGEIFRVPYVLE